MAYALPSIHLNGTGAQTLFDDYQAFHLAILNAEKALDMATFNARDFYPQEEAWKQACKDRADAFRKLAELQQYAEAWLGLASDHIS
jgi:hypothetical protein